MKQATLVLPLRILPTVAAYGSLMKREMYGVTGTSLPHMADRPAEISLQSLRQMCGFPPNTLHTIQFSKRTHPPKAASAPQADS
jgi:hypothetical protein